MKTWLFYSLLFQNVLNMQVDGPEECQDSENTSTFTSIGVQVENDRGSVSLLVVFLFNLSPCSVMTQWHQHCRIYCLWESKQIFCHSLIINANFFEFFHLIPIFC